MCDRRKDIRDLFDSEVTVGEELEESVVLEQLGRQVWTEEGLAEVTRHRDHASRPSRAEQTISAAHERRTGRQDGLDQYRWEVRGPLQLAPE